MTPEKDSGSREMERRVEDARWRERIEGKIDAILDTQQRHEQMFEKLPCVEHGKVIAGLRVASGFWGVIGATLALAGAWLLKKI